MADPKLFRDVKQRSSVDYLLRTQHQNSVLLVQIADQKANILIGLAAVVLTMILTRYELQQIPAPLAAFATSLLLAAGVSLLTLLPRMGWQRRSESNSMQRLLNFKIAATMEKHEYLGSMAGLLEHDDSVYFHQASELHDLSRILHRKYQYLKISYLLFAAGVVVTGVLLIVSLEPTQMTNGALSHLYSQ